MQNKAFRDLEHESWSQRASLYDELFAAISTQAIPHFLSCVAHWPSKRHLDVACGTGHLVAAIAKQGALSEGVDFAQPMIEVAQANYPASRFDVADAAHLPYEDCAFDVVTCAFGLSHMEAPQAACDEAYRVLKPGGCFAFTLWFGAEAGGELHALVKAAIRAHATQTSALPNSWTQLRFAHQDDCSAIVQGSGFNRPTFRTLPIACRSTAAEAVLNIVDKLSVRSAAMIATQPEQTRLRIREQILLEAEARRRNGIIELAWPALLTIAEKPV
jgi:ubiquinone/menaquinone biosynthesis C-methylase UbiE